MKMFRKVIAIACASLIILSSVIGALPIISTASAADTFTIEICNPLYSSTDCTGTSKTVETLLESVIDYILIIGAPIAAVMYVIAGFMFLTSAGDPKKIATAKQAIIWTSVGLAVILIGRGLVEIVKNLF